MKNLTKKQFIFIGICIALITFYFYKKSHTYLDPTKAHLMIQQGVVVLCTDTDGRKYYPTSNQFLFPAGGLYFYKIDGEAVTTTNCVED